MHMRKPSLATGSPPSPTPLPWSQLAVLLGVACIEPISASVIYPFAVNAVSLSGITSDPKRLGFYAGWIDGVFFLFEAIFVLQWSRLSDRRGRKPILCVGLCGIAISMASFGFARSYPALLASRAIAGSLSANIAVIKSTMGELLDDTNKARGFSLLASTWPLASIVGPLLGGMLARPATRFSTLFTSPLWATYPFALPCLIAASFSIVAMLVAMVFLEETLASRRRPSDYAPLRTLDSPDMQEKAASAPFAKPTALRTLVRSRPVQIAILTYALLAGIDLAFLAIFVLFATSTIEHGGIGMTEAQIGIYLAAWGALTGLLQTFAFDPLYRRFGVRRLYQILMATFSIPFLLLPCINLAARNNMPALVVTLLVLMLVPLSIAALTYSTTFLIVNASAGNSSLGAVNGLAQTCISIMRCFAPAASSSLFAFAASRDMLWILYLTCVLWSLASVATGALIQSDIPSTPRTDEAEPFMRAAEMDEVHHL